MITRRRFVQASIAASAAAFFGCRQKSAQAPVKAAADAELHVYFVGGTVFVKAGDGVMGLQLSGKGQSYNGHSLEHASYIAGPSTLFPGGVQLPAFKATSGRLPPAGSAAVCLVKKTVTIDGGMYKGATIKCNKLANYDDVAANWTRNPSSGWDAASNPAINSIFKLQDGDLVDEKAVNQAASQVQWWVKDKLKKKELSDVAVLNLKAPKITIAGATADPIILDQGQQLSLYVFSGPLETHKPGYKYKQITHALLLKTIYDVNGTTDDEIMPTTDTEIEGDMGDEVTSPCDHTRKLRVPPDSEYCPNYDKLP